MTGQTERSVAQVQAEVLAAMRPIEGQVRVALHEALGRVLACDMVSPIDVPAHDNSAMDGYALKGASLAAGQQRFRVIGTVLAGRPGSLVPGPDEAVRITTGAVMPEGCDTVVVQEVCRLEGDSVTVPPDAARPGENRRLRGEDLRQGQVAVAAGRSLRPADLGLLASLGIDHALVRPRLRVAIFSTGDEVQAPGQPLGPGQIYDSNRYTLTGMLTRLGFEVIDLGVVRDSPAELEQSMRKAASLADAIISSGGVSVGEADYTKDVMRALGEVNFWRIAMRPGRPMAFGTVLDTPYFGLPGNPVAVMITFYFFARQALLRLAGALPLEAPLFAARLLTPIRKKPGRVEYQRAIVSRGADGALEVSLTGQQGSGVLRSMSEANAIIVMAAEQGSAQVGQSVQCLAFEGLV